MNGELIFVIWYGLTIFVTGIIAYRVIKKDIYSEEINNLDNEEQVENK